MALITIADLRSLKQGHSFRKVQSRYRGSERTIVAAVCYRMQPDGKIEFLLVRTSAGRWTFPKGGVDDDRTAAAAAGREAFEEAGVTGRVHRSCLTRYLHGSRSQGMHLVDAHLCEVMNVGPTAEAHRAPTWFTVEKAKRRLREDRPAPLGEELERVVNAAVRHLANSERNRYRRKPARQN